MKVNSLATWRVNRLSTLGGQSCPWSFRFWGGFSCWRSESQPLISGAPARLTQILRRASQTVLRRVLRRCIVLGLKGKVSQKGFQKGVVARGFQKVLRTPCWKVRPPMRVPYIYHPHKKKTITNENLGICFRFRFRNGKANKFPQFSFAFVFVTIMLGKRKPQQQATLMK